MPNVYDLIQNYASLSVTCLDRLYINGYVPTLQSELERAQARYEEALPMFRALGDRLGEANTLKSLGDLALRVSDLDQARARYEGALAICRANGARLGEAGAIAGLADVAAAEGKHGQTW